MYRGTRVNERQAIIYNSSKLLWMTSDTDAQLQTTVTRVGKDFAQRTGFSGLKHSEEVSNSTNQSDRQNAAIGGENKAGADVAVAAGVVVLGVGGRIGIRAAADGRVVDVDAGSLATGDKA